MATEAEENDEAVFVGHPAVEAEENLLMMTLEVLCLLTEITSLCIA